MADCESSDLEIWLRKRFMTTNRFAKLVGCNRTVVWKVKKGLPICPYYARAIKHLTDGEIQPLVERVGRHGFNL